MQYIVSNTIKNEIVSTGDFVRAEPGRALAHLMNHYHLDGRDALYLYTDEHKAICVCGDYKIQIGEW